MLTKVYSGATIGLSSRLVTVEVDISEKGLPSFTIVGLPDKAVEESKERVRSAIRNSGAEFPVHRITVNLAPADLPKEGPQYDLPIAIGLLFASGQLPELKSKDLFLGELSLDGSVRHTKGILPITLFAKEIGCDQIYVPADDAGEASVVSNIRIMPVTTLVSLFRHISGTAKITASEHKEFSSVIPTQAFDYDMTDIHGQEQAKRVMEIAAAGGHNMYMHGPPGAGKTLLARTLPSILPAMTEDEALEVTKIYSITGNLPSGSSLMTYRPFRAPHHTMSQIGLIGGGTHPSPGEISLAHRGILFLDEFPEFPRHVLEALRQPMEDGVVTISRAAASAEFPAKFMLITAANPCPCGNFGSENRRCTCLPGQISRYQKRISGPILDRIDLHIHVPAVAVEKLTDVHIAPETSSEIRKRVGKAREIQVARLSGTGCQCNADMSVKLTKKICMLTPDATGFFRQAAARFGLSARSFYRVLKVSRTIADLSLENTIQISHIAEAFQYRPKEFGS